MQQNFTPHNLNFKDSPTQNDLAVLLPSRAFMISLYIVYSHSLYFWINSHSPCYQMSLALFTNVQDQFCLVNSPLKFVYLWVWGLPALMGHRDTTGRAGGRWSVALHPREHVPVNRWAHMGSMGLPSFSLCEILSVFLPEDPRDTTKGILQNSESVMFSENELMFFLLASFSPKGLSSSELNVAQCWAPGPQCTSLAWVWHQGPAEVTMTCAPLAPGALLSLISVSGACLPHI